MPRRNHSAEEIIYNFREAVIAAGSTVVEAKPPHRGLGADLLPVEVRVQSSPGGPGEAREATGNGERPAQGGGG